MNRFFETILEVLRQDNRFFTEDGELLRNAVVEAAGKMDAKLIKALYENKTTRERFFTDVDGIAVFDKVAFGYVINNREFLPDSYTRYKNKIGLTNSRGEYISTSRDVELVFPYKDCVLEGGQTKEDQKRDEIFYNETLAPDEVDRLLYPKVLVNAKRYSYDGDYDLIGQPTGEGSVKIDTDIDFKDTDNLIIKGNNLLALGSLLRRYENKVKSVFVDPPYFFYKKKKVDTFEYNSNFHLSTWLTFCKNRFELAKKLLSDDGILAVTMGVDGYSHLKILLDEIFDVSDDSSRYIGTITWRKTDNQSNVGNFSNVIDYILLYRKSNKGHLNNLPLSEKAIKEYSYEDEIGRYRRSNICDLTRGTHIYEVETPDGSTLNGPWMIEENEFKQLKKNNGIHWPEKGAQIPYGKIYLKDSLKKGQITSDFWDGSYGTNQRGADEMKLIFGERAFPFAKPETLLMNILTLTSSEGDLVLDFFIGSGTTTAVAHKMGRRYIGVEQLDYIESLSVERMKKVIDGDNTPLSKVLNWQGGGSFVYCELAKLNQAYVDRIQDAEDDAALSKIYDDILKTGFISYKVDPKDIDLSSEDFTALSLDEKKKLLMELLDNNQLYINYCDMDDESFAVSEEDKAFTRSFYGEA